MKILNRSPKSIIAIFWQFPRHIPATMRCFILFYSPVEVLCCYIRRRNPTSLKVKLRNGYVIQLSRDNSDIVTVFLIFCRHDYGKIVSGSVVVDIGANIGVFALYAACQGAKVVQAYEPAEESFNLLKRNIANNGLDNIVFPHKAAVVGKPSAHVWFSRKSSVFNAIDTSHENQPDYDLVPSITLANIVKDILSFNILKMDCEGGEYDIVINSEDSVFERIEEIRLEYHVGPHQELFDRFTKLGFIRYQFMDGGKGAGYLWLTRPRHSRK